MASMITKSEATIADLYKVEGKAELVNGEIVKLMPTGWLPGFASDEISASLRAHAKRTQTGHAVGDNRAFLVNLPHRKSFSPDAAFFTGPTSGMHFLEGAPDFAVEVRSEGDYGPRAERDMAGKRDDYFAAGKKVVWDVDLLSEDVVRKYTSDVPQSAKVFRKGKIADAEPAVPGWRIPVADLFDESR